MADLRQAYAGTRYANLGWSELTERPIDRVAAAGFADALGVMLWRARQEESASAAVLAASMLVVRFRNRYGSESVDMARRIAHQCLLEFLKSACEVCLGRGEAVLKNGVKIVCGACRGSRVKRYSDHERARGMAISLAKTRAVAHKLRWLGDEIARLDSGVNRVMNEQLERVENS